MSMHVRAGSSAAYACCVSDINTLLELCPGSFASGCRGCGCSRWWLWWEASGEVITNDGGDGRSAPSSEATGDPNMPWQNAVCCGCCATAPAVSTEDCRTAGWSAVWASVCRPSGASGTSSCISCRSKGGCERGRGHCWCVGESASPYRLYFVDAMPHAAVVALFGRRWSCVDAPLASTGAAAQPRAVCWKQDRSLRAGAGDLEGDLEGSLEGDFDASTKRGWESTSPEFLQGL